FAEAPSRAEQARRALLDFIEALRLRGGHRGALVTFAGQPRVEGRLTHDLDHFRDVLESIDVSEHDPTLGARTRLGAALLLAVQTDEGRSSRARDVILLSDGDDPARDGEWRRGIKAAQAEGVPVLCVGFGDANEDHRIPDGKGWLRHEGKDVTTRLE